VVNGLGWRGHMASMGEDRNIYCIKANLYLCPPLKHMRSGGSALPILSSWKPLIPDG